MDAGSDHAEVAEERRTTMTRVVPLSYAFPPSSTDPPAEVLVELDWQTGQAVGAWSNGCSYCKQDHRNTLVRYTLSSQSNENTPKPSE